MARTFYGRREEEVPEAEQIQEIAPEETLIPANDEARPTRTEIDIFPQSDVAIIQTAQKVIGEDEIHEAVAILQKYKAGKKNFETRIKDDELWWELRHWEAIRKKHEQIISPKSTSAWLFNALDNKHADAMDNYPEPIVLPRERSDEHSAEVLTSILPVVMEYNDFETTYDLNWWEKLKHGTAVYGVFWSSQKENGLGDIDIQKIDLLSLYWEPGVTDIQKSRNLFIVGLVDTDILETMYPEYEGRLKGGEIDVAEYLYDDDVDTDEKSVVIDWYYKVTDESGQTILHYCKFCNDCVLYASENDPEYAQRGVYDHGEYPIVLDVMYPEKGTPCGFGDIAICKDPQMYIDQLSTNILELSMMDTRPRFFASESTAINEDEFLDWSKPIVHVAGELGEERLREIQVSPLNGIYMSVMEQKITEMKETASNRDANAGGNNNLTAAAAISAVMEAGNKVSRSHINASYRAYSKICKLCIELMRQFYDETRVFRVLGETEAQYQFEEINNQMIGLQQTGIDAMGDPTFRLPIFDLKVKAQKRNPFSTMEANQRAQELYAMGFFNPEKAQESLPALEMMEFEGIDKVREYVKQGQTLLNIVMQQQQTLDQMSTMLQQITGIPMEGQPQMQAPQPQQEAPEPTASKTVGKAAQNASTPMTAYGQRLAERAKPNMNATSNAATPGRS